MLSPSGRLRQCNDDPTATAVFGLGSFWGAEAVFGAVPGVLRTRVGYAGGTTEEPTHTRIGDHMEVVEVAYDPQRLAFTTLLRCFFAHHDPTRDPTLRKRQHRSVIGCPRELAAVACTAILRETKRRGRPVHTVVIAPQPFYVAELYHQKWHLRRVEAVWDALTAIYGDEWAAVNSTIAARCNAYVRGYGQPKQLRADLMRWPLPSDARAALLHAYGLPDDAASNC